jgi:hypothetical protein
MKTLNDIAIGAELETVGRTRAQVAQAIKSVVGGQVVHVAHPGCYDPYQVVDTQGRTWTVVADSSLTNVPADLRAEIVTPILGVDDIATLQEIVRAVRRAGARCDEKCGLHVHLSCPDITPQAVANLAKMVHKQEEIIYAALGVTAERQARYCRPMSAHFIERITAKPPKTFRDLNTAWYGQYTPQPHRYDCSRYYALNLNAFFYRGAIEWRAWPGAMHAGKIKAAIIFCMAMLVKAMNSKATSAKKRAYNPQTVKYDFRVWLVSALALNGDAYKNVRKHLLSRMPGDSAFKHGAAQRPARVKTTTTPAAVA